MPSPVAPCRQCGRQGLDSHHWYCPACFTCLTCNKVIKRKFVQCP